MRHSHAFLCRAAVLLLASLVATVNRAIVTLRRFLGWLLDEGHVPSNPGKPVKELRRVELAPKGLDRADVRRLLREVEDRRRVGGDRSESGHRHPPGPVGEPAGEGGRHEP